MSPEIVRPQFDAGKFSCFLHHDPGGSVRDRKNLVFWLQPLALHACPQTLYHLSRDEDHLRILSALWILDDELLIVHVIGGQFQDFPDSHAASGHEFQDQSVSELRRSENDLIHGLLFDNVPEDGLAGPVDLPVHRGIARVLNAGIQVGLDEIEKGFEVGVTAVFRLLLAAFGDLVEQREDLFRCDGSQIALSKKYSQNLLRVAP